MLRYVEKSILFILALFFGVGLAYAYQSKVRWPPRPKFHVKLENQSGQNLKVSCTTTGQSHPVIATQKQYQGDDGRTITCNGKEQLDPWPYKNSGYDLYFKEFYDGMGHDPLDTHVVVDFFRPDGSMFCRLLLHYSGPYYEPYFNTFNYVNYCTKDYLEKSQEYYDATVHIKDLGPPPTLFFRS